MFVDNFSSSPEVKEDDSTIQNARLADDQVINSRVSDILVNDFTCGPIPFDSKIKGGEIAGE